MNDKMELNEENRGKDAKIRVCPHCGASKQGEPPAWCRRFF